MITESYSIEIPIIYVEIRADILSSSDVTLKGVKTVFNDGLTGRNNDFLNPDSRVYIEDISSNETAPGKFGMLQLPLFLVSSG